MSGKEEDGRRHGERKRVPKNAQEREEAKKPRVKKLVWEDEEEEEEEEEEQQQLTEEGCVVCGGNDDQTRILVCERCYDQYHLYCLPRPLTKVPEYDWFCPYCKNLKPKRSATQPTARPAPAAVANTARAPAQPQQQGRAVVAVASAAARSAQPRQLGRALVASSAARSAQPRRQGRALVASSAARSVQLRRRGQAVAASAAARSSQSKANNKGLFFNVFDNTQKDANPKKAFGYIELPSTESTFSDARQAILANYSYMSAWIWNFVFPPLAPMSQQQESREAILPFLYLIFDNDQLGNGTPQNPYSLFIEKP